MTSQKNFDLLLNISKLHFNWGHETYVLDNSRERPYPYFKELCKEFSENWPMVIIGDEEFGYIWKTPKKEVNVIYMEFNIGITNLFSTKKILFYIDLREDYSTCSTKNYLTKMPKYLFYIEFFQSIILFHFQKNCSNEYEIWTRVPWSKKPGEKIKNIKDAYFNKKPNLHNTITTFYSTVDGVRNYRQAEKSSLELFRQIWFEKWNIVDSRSTNIPPILTAAIFDEPYDFFINTDAYTTMSMCFVVQKGKDRPKWEAIIWCFHWKVWLLLTVMWLISGAAWFFFNKQNSLSLSLFKMYSLILTEPIYWLPSLNRNSHRFIAGLLMLMSIVITTGFQSNLYKYMQVPPVYPPINEIKQIKNRNLSIFCTFPFSCYMIFGISGISTDKLFSEMVYQFLDLDVTTSYQQYTRTLMDVYNHPNYALITSCESARWMINKIPTLSKKLHVVEETITMYPIYYQVFPFQKQMRQLILSYYESGIGQWADHMTQWKKLIYILFREKSQKPPVKVFTMDDLQIAFIILFVGLSISTFIFILECISKYWLLREGATKSQN